MSYKELMNLVGNEQIKPLANAIDRISTALVTVGVPIRESSLVYGSRVELIALA